MQGNNANNQPMGKMSGMMPMGMGMPMMGMPMMGMPMMNPLMAMPMMNQMNPMMNPMGVTSMGSKTPSGPSAGCGNTVAPPAKASPSSSTGGLMPKLDTPTVPTGPTPTRLEPGRVVSGRERSRSRDVEREPKLEPKEEPIQPVREKTPPRCHLHNTKKPNAKCKFCQKWLSSQSQSQCQKVPEKEDAKDEKAKVHLEKDEEEDYSRRTFKSSTLLKDQILGSSYFKSLLEVSDLPPLTDEIARYADTLDVYNSGNNVHPSCFICQVYRLFTLPQSEDLEDLLAILDGHPSAKVRCAGVLYVRFVVPPHKLWEKLEENLFDEQELKYLDGDKQVTTTIQEYVENLLIKDKYYNTPLPRIPVKVRQHLEKELAPLSQFRKRMAAMQKALPKKVSGTAVEVYVDGSWLPGHIKQYVGNHKRRVGIVLENGSVVNSHLGKVVLRDEEKEEGKAKTEVEENKEDREAEEKKTEKTDKSEKSLEKKKERKERDDSRPSSSRSRSRHRSRSRRRRSPDWARYKGPILDASEIERLREKAREDAVVGVGKVYSKRPTTVEGELWRGSGGDARVSMLGPQHIGGGSRSSTSKGPDPEIIRTRSREEEEEHKRRMREIYEKYGSVSRATSGNSGSHRSEIDQPDVLRLG